MKGWLRKSRANIFAIVVKRILHAASGIDAETDNDFQSPLS
jgi:hypothetical protein